MMIRERGGAINFSVGYGITQELYFQSGLKSGLMGLDSIRREGLEGPEDLRT
jgi:hypothetical protein